MESKEVLVSPTDKPTAVTSFLVLTVVSLVGIRMGMRIIIPMLKTRKKSDLPPGNLGNPLVGETIRFLRAFKGNKINEFISERVAAYGPVFKTCLFGQPTVVFTGPAGNQFWLFNDGKLFHGNVRGPHRAILGLNSLLDRTGEEHKRMRAAIHNFFAPESLKKVVGKMDSVIRRHLDELWDGRDFVHAVRLLKFQAFSFTCNVLFNLQEREQVEELRKLFTVASDGIYSLNLNFPGTRLHRALRARMSIDRILSPLIERRKNDILEGVEPLDLISTLLRMTNKDGKPLSDRELKDNIVLLTIAGYETTAMTLALVCKLLASNPHHFHPIAQESEEIVSKRCGEELTWEDVQGMKYLWRVVQETLRIIPPVSGIFRQAIADIVYGGYTIPKGWTLYWSNYSTVYLDDLFPEPHKFNPTRFEGSSRIAPYSFMPFGGGPRMCPGNEYAKLEILITMHHLVKRFRWTAEYPDEPIVRNPLCFPARGLPLRLSSIQKM